MHSFFYQNIQSRLKKIAKTCVTIQASKLRFFVQLFKKSEKYLGAKRGFQYKEIIMTWRLFQKNILMGNRIGDEYGILFGISWIIVNW